MPFKTEDDIKSQDKYAAILKQDIERTRARPLAYAYYETYCFSNKRQAAILLVGNLSSIPEPVRKELSTRCGKPKATGMCQRIPEGVNFSLLQGSITAAKLLGAMLGGHLSGKAFIVEGFGGTEEPGGTDASGKQNGSATDDLSALRLDAAEASRLKNRLDEISHPKLSDIPAGLRIDAQQAAQLKQRLDAVSPPKPGNGPGSLKLDAEEAARLKQRLDSLSRPPAPGGDLSSLKIDAQAAAALKKRLDDVSGVRIGVTPEHKTKAETLVTRLKAIRDADPNFFRNTAALLTAALDGKQQRTSTEIDTQLARVKQALDAWRAPAPNAAAATPKLSPSQQKAKDRDTKQKHLEAETELAVLRVGLVLSPELISIMNEHKGAVAAERQAFAGIRFMDDVFAVKDEAARRAKVKAISTALSAVRDRRQRMSDAITDNPGFDPTDPNGNADPAEVGEARLTCRQFWDGMSSHVPDEFDLYLKERDFSARLRSLDDVTGKNAPERRRLVDAAANVPQEDQDEERGAFLAAIGHGSLKPAEMTAFYFDEPVRPITPEQQRALYEANEKLIQRANRVHDLGGSVADVEKALAHVPEEFWPPQFVEDLQAWRKVEREMAEERVAELFADPKKLTKLEVFTGFTGAAGLVGDVMSLVGGCSDLAKGVSMAMQYEDLQSMGLDKDTIKASSDWKTLHENGTITQAQFDALNEYKGISGPLDGPKVGSTDEQIGKDVRMVIEQVKDLTKGVNPFAKALSLDNLSLKEQLDTMTPEDIIMAVGKFASVIAKLKSIGAISGAGAAGEVFAKNFCPVLGAVASGMDMVAVSLQLKKVAEERNIALAQLKNADLDFFSGKETDTAMLNALINEKGARNRQTTKKSVELSAKVITFAGDAVATGQMGDPTGATTATGAALKILAKSIELGNKVVFSGIDWSIARKAMALLDEAQAGNPVARVEIFKDCGLYAKMYLCCAARDGSITAKQYIIDRGLTEGDLTKSMALKVLREKLLKKSDQKDESKNTNLGGVLVEGLTSAETRNVGNRMVGAVGGGMRKVAQKLREKFPGPAYVPRKWTPPGAPQLSKDEWHAQKKLAVENGLHLAKVGLGDALENFTKAEDRANVEMRSPGQTGDDKTKRAQAIARTIEAAETVANLIGKLDPTTNGGEPYPEMIDHLAGLRTLAGQKATAWNAKLYQPDVGAKTTNWQPVTNTNLAPFAWTTNWQDAVKRCMLPAEDHGVGKRLQTLAELARASAVPSKSAAEARKAKLAVRDAFKEVVEALNRCSREVGEFPTVVSYLNQLITLVVQGSQKLHEDLAKAKWNGGPAGQDVKASFTPAGWKGIYDSASAQGFVAGDDKGLGSALSDLAKAEAVLAKPSDGEARGKARAQVIRDSVIIAKAVAKLRQANSETHEDFTRLLADLEKEAHQRCAGARGEFAKVSFTQVGGELTKQNWNDTYEAAVKAGAVPKDDAARKRLSDTIAAAADAESTYQKDKKPESRLKSATEYQKTLKTVLSEIQFVRHTPGFEHPTMQRYCGAMETWAKAKNDEPGFKKVLIGDVDDSAFQPPPAFVWTHKSWTDVKAQAVKCGLMPPKQTGFGKLLDASDDTHKKWEKAQGDDKATRRDAALQLLEQTANVGETLRAKTPPGKLKDYMNLFAGEVTNRRTALG